MTTPEMNTTRLNIVQLKLAATRSRPVPGDRSMGEFLAQFHRYMLAKRELSKQRRHLKRLEREERRDHGRRFEYFALEVKQDMFDGELRRMKRFRPLQPRSDFPV